MKKFVSIAAVAGLLLAAALYYGSLRQGVEVEAITSPTPSSTPSVMTSSSPNASASASGTLTLKGAVSHAYLNQGEQSEVYATIDIDAIKHQGSQRPPLNVALVIDRSGSMAGEKIQYAKQAARRMVGMFGPQDRVAIVSYGSDATVDVGSRLVTSSNRALLLDAIDRIEVSGGTNLSGGYERGLSEVRTHQSDRAISRVLLMSDGNANIGTTYLPDLQRISRAALSQGVSLSTIGVGLDYNEDVMTGMANEGAGNYYFVDSADSIASSFDQEITGLTSSVARNTALIIKLAPGVELSDLYGFPYHRQGDELRIPLSEFFSEQSKDVLMKLTVPAALVGQARPILDVQLSYTDLVQSEKLAHQSVSLHGVTTADAAQVEEHVNADVIARVQQIEVAQSMKSAMDLFGEGKAEQATELVETQQRRTRRAREKYNIKGAKYDRVDQELNLMNQQIKTIEPKSSSGKRMIKSKKARSNSIVMSETAF